MIVLLPPTRASQHYPESVEVFNAHRAGIMGPLGPMEHAALIGTMGIMRRVGLKARMALGPTGDALRPAGGAVGPGGALGPAEDALGPTGSALGPTGGALGPTEGALGPTGGALGDSILIDIDQ